MFTDWFTRVQATKLGLSASMASARPPRLGAAGAFGLQARRQPAKPRGLGIAATLSRPLTGVFERRAHPAGIISQGPQTKSWSLLQPPAFAPIPASAPAPGLAAGTVSACSRLRKQFGGLRKAVGQSGNLRTQCVTFQAATVCIRMRCSHMLLRRGCG